MTSKASNGEVRLRPLPVAGLAHCVLLLPEQGDYLQSFRKAFELRLPNLDPFRPHDWAVASSPRPCSFGIMAQGAWKWHILIDPAGMSPEVEAAVLDGDLGEQVKAAIERQAVCVMVFLLEGPEEATPIDRMRALCEAAWAWLDVGAEVLIWPEGRTASLRGTLIGLRPVDLEPEHSYLFVSNGVAAHQSNRSRYWLRTWGMGQFALPDLCASVVSNKPVFEAELESLKLLFETLPPAMIREHGVLPTGGTVQVGERLWTASTAPEDAPTLASRYGLQYFE